MIDDTYSEAVAEVLDILSHTSKDDLEKIPIKFINFLEKNKSKTYKAELDYSKNINEIKLKSKTKAMLGLIYMNYWADEEEKKNFKQKIRENEIKYQAEMRQKYNPNNLFDKNKK